MATRARGGTRPKLKDVDLYRSRPINREAAKRFPHILYYAVHFDEETPKFAFAFLGKNAERDDPDVLIGLEAHEQWGFFVDVMTRDPALSGVKVERLGRYDELESCMAAARDDAAHFAVA